MSDASGPHWPSVFSVNTETLDSRGANPLTQLTIGELRGRTSIKWRAFPPDVLPLWVAEMDVPLAPAVAEALRSALDRSDTGYPAGTAYAEALQAFAAARWSWHGLDVGRTRLVPDVMLGIVESLRLVTGSGDAVVVTPPVYAPFFAFVTHADRRIVEAPLTPGGRLDPAALADAFARARSLGPNPAFLLCNPHNPTGTVHTRAELEQVAALAREHGVRVVSDEIHAPLVLPGATFTPFLDVAGAENGMVLMSASKAFNLAGLKAALAIAGEEAAADLARMPEEVGHGASHLAVIAHTAALHDGGPWLDALLEGLDRNRTLLAGLLAEHLPTVRYGPHEGTYLAWLDCRALGIDDDGDSVLAVTSAMAGPARHFLDRARVALSSGHVFGTGGRGHVRLNLATTPEILTAAITAMGRSVPPSS